MSDKCHKGRKKTKPWAPNPQGRDEAPSSALFSAWLVPSSRAHHAARGRGAAGAAFGGCIGDTKFVTDVRLADQDRVGVRGPHHQGVEPGRGRHGRREAGRALRPHGRRALPRRPPRRPPASGSRDKTAGFGSHCETRRRRSSWARGLRLEARRVDGRLASGSWDKTIRIGTCQVMLPRRRAARRRRPRHVGAKDGRLARAAARTA